MQIVNYEPFVYLGIKNQTKNDCKVKCLADTWFTGLLSIPYFVWKWEYDSLVNQIEFMEGKTKLNPKSKWVETASWISKTYKSYITVELNWIETESEILIYEHDSEYSERRDIMLLWIEFIEMNGLHLNIKANWGEFIKHSLK